MTGRETTSCTGCVPLSAMYRQKPSPGGPGEGWVRALTPALSQSTGGGRSRRRMCRGSSCAFRRHCGFILFEMMVTIALLATFALVSTQLLQRSLTVAHDANRVAGLASTFDTALGQMRRDVW